MVARARDWTRTNLFVFNGLPCLGLVLPGNATQFVVIQGKLPLVAWGGLDQGSLFVLWRRTGSRITVRLDLPALDSAVQAGLCQLEVPDRPSTLLIVVKRPNARALQVGILAKPVGPLQLPLLGDQVGEGALAAEDVASRAGNGISGNL